MELKRDDQMAMVAGNAPDACSSPAMLGALTERLAHLLFSAMVTQNGWTQNGENMRGYGKVSKRPKGFGFRTLHKKTIKTL